MAMVRKAMLPDFACREITEFSAPTILGAFSCLLGKEGEFSVRVRGRRVFLILMEG